jgi:hypothetical protein
MKLSRIKLSGLLTILLAFTSNLLHAEPDVITNVHGDEIIIYSDDPIPKSSDKKSVSPTPATAPANSAATSPVYNNGDGVMPKGSRDNRLGRSFDLDTSLDDPDLIAAPQIDRDDLWQRIKNGYAPYQNQLQS